MGLALRSSQLRKVSVSPYDNGPQMVGSQFSFGRTPAAVHTSGIRVHKLRSRVMTKTWIGSSIASRLLQPPFSSTRRISGMCATIYQVVLTERYSNSAIMETAISIQPAIPISLTTRKKWMPWCFARPMGTKRNLMKYNTALLLSFGIPVLCLASTPAPYAGHCALLDRVLAVTRSQSHTSTIAIELLERVAEGRAGTISTESEVQVGLTPGVLTQKAFNEATVRACALQKLGESGLPEAVGFLEKLKPADFGTDTTQQLWPAAQIGLRVALLNRIEDVRSRIEFRLVRGICG
jgi:hypothetical protein